MNQNPNMNGRPSKPDDGAGKQSLVDEAKNVAGHVAEQARDQATSKIDAQKEKAVETIGNVADAIRGAGGKLEGQGPLPQIADQAADTIESVANYFRTRNVGDLVREVERFARREPAIFLGASFAIGLIGGRFLKSSKPSGARESSRRDALMLEDDDTFYARRPPPPPRDARSMMGTAPSFGTNNPNPMSRVVAGMTNPAPSEGKTLPTTNPETGNALGAGSGLTPPAAVTKPVNSPTNTLPGTGGMSGTTSGGTGSGGNRGGMGRV